MDLIAKLIMDHISPRCIQSAGILVATVLLTLTPPPAASYPSTRRVYYLHTRAASWEGARDTCARYQGRLLTYTNPEVVDNDIITLDQKLNDWGGAFSDLSDNVWTGLLKYRENNSLHMMWHGCQIQDPNDSDTSISALKASSSNCLSLDTTLDTDPTDCSTRLPYICTVDTGQCWFWPLENKAFDTSSNTFSTETKTADLNSCAQYCRNSTLITNDDSECWAFVLESDDACVLYFSEIRHDYLINSDTYMNSEDDAVVYLKVCAGGETSTLAAAIDDASDTPQEEDCASGAWTEEEWLDSVCYCDCNEPPVILEPKDMVLSEEEMVDKIVEELTVDTTNLSSTTRKLNSAEDDRSSSKGLGALGIAMMSLVFGGIVLMDLDGLVTYLSAYFQGKGVSGADTVSDIASVQ